MDSSPLSPDEFRAAAEAYHELGPEYRTAVTESFVEKINRETALLRNSPAQHTQPDRQISQNRPGIVPRCAG